MISNFYMGFTPHARQFQTTFWRAGDISPLSLWIVISTWGLHPTLANFYMGFTPHARQFLHGVDAPRSPISRPAAKLPDLFVFVSAMFVPTGVLFSQEVFVIGEVPFEPAHFAVALVDE